MRKNFSLYQCSFFWKFLINKIINFLKDNIGKDFLFLKFLTNINLVGSSYHYGSSFPMSKNNKNNERSTSIVGELSGYSNIYILDASILPDMPASPTTLNVCINASRIIKKLSIEGKIWKKILKNTALLQKVLGFGLILTLIQIGMGTQVRQFVDDQMHAFNLENTSAWLANAPLMFYFHRSFSLLVLLVHGYLGYLLYKNKMVHTVFTLILSNPISILVLKFKYK